MVDQDIILRHRDFVSALARRLVSDPEEAADVEQEAWLTTISSPPRDENRVIPWLRSVILNRVRSRHREVTRREAREKASAVPERIEVADSLETADIVDRIGRAVRTLDPPQREAIVLRFYEDLTPSEIGTRLGVPVETVRTRIRRGLSQLRIKLDHSYGGDRRRWVTALGPILGPRSSWGGPASSIVGVLTMSGLWKILVVVVGIGAGLILWDAKSERDVPGATSDESAAFDTAPVDGNPDGHTEIRKEIIEDSLSSVEPPKSPSAPQGFPTVILNIVDEDERAIPHAEVLAYRVCGEARDGHREFVADEQGVCIIDSATLWRDDSVSAALSDWCFEVRGLGYIDAFERVDGDERFEETDVERTVYLDRGGMATLKVLDFRRREIVDGVEISARGMGDGRVEFGWSERGSWWLAVRETSTISLSVEHAQHGSAFLPAVFVHGSRRMALPDVVLGGEASISGVVTGERGTVWEGVTLHADWLPASGPGRAAMELGLERATATTDSMGRFTFHGLHRGLYALSTEYGDLVGDEEPNVLAGSQDVMLVLQGSRLRARVQDEQGRGCPGATLHIEEVGERGRSSVVDVEAVDGWVDLWAEPGRYRLSAFGRGMRSEAREVSLESGRSQRAGVLTLRSVGLSDLRLQLIDHQGRSVGIEQVNLHSCGGIAGAGPRWPLTDEALLTGWIRGITSGACEFTVVPGDIHDHESPRSFQPVRRSVMLEPGENALRVVLQTGGRLSIQVKGMPHRQGVPRPVLGARWRPEGGAPIMLRRPLPPMPPLPGSPPPESELWVYRDVLPPGPGHVLVLINGQPREFPAEVKVNEVTLVSVEWR